MLDRAGFVPPPIRRSPLEHREPISTPDGALQLAERKFIGKLNIRGNPEDIAAPFAEAAGAALPVEPCTATSAHGLSALWLGPSEWMLITGEGEETKLAGDIGTAFDGLHYQLTDVTDYYTIIRISGANARGVLMKLTTLDMHPARFDADAVKGSVFGRVPAVLHCAVNASADSCAFDLIIRRSHADYLWCLLALAGREFGLPEQTPEGRVKLAYPG